MGPIRLLSSRASRLSAATARRLRFDVIVRSASASATPPTPDVKAAAEPTSSASVEPVAPKSSFSALGAVGALAAGGGLFYAWQSGALQSPSVAPSMSAVPSRAVPEKEEAKPEVESKVSELAAEVAVEVDASSVAQEEVAPPVVVEPPLPPPPPPVLMVEESVLALEQEATRIRIASAESSRLAGIEQRNAAKQALRDAVESKDFAQLQLALAAASEACLGTCAESELAESLVTPSLQLRRALQPAADAAGQCAADAADSEFAATADMSEDELRSRVIELSRCVAAGRLYGKVRLEEVLATNLEAAEACSLEIAEEGLKRLKADLDEQAVNFYTELETGLIEQHADTIASRKAEASRDAEERLANEDADMQEVSDTTVAFMKSLHLDEVISFASGLKCTQEAVDDEQSEVERYYARNGLSQALVILEDSILAGRSCEAELEAVRLAAGKADSFVADMLANLPSGCMTLCQHGAVPTEDAIKKHLPSQLHELASTAFLPPGGGLAAELIGRFFRSLYVVNSEAHVALSGEDGAAQEVRRNLAAISRLAQAKSPGELEEALLHLEGSLTGSCVEEAKEWLHETRCALLLRQAIWAAKARVQCLTCAAA